MHVEGFLLTNELIIGSLTTDVVALPPPLLLLLLLLLTRTGKTSLWLNSRNFSTTRSFKVSL